MSSAVDSPAGRLEGDDVVGQASGYFDCSVDVGCLVGRPHLRHSSPAGAPDEVARHRLDATRPELVWADFTAPVPATMTAPSEDYQKIANAFYETSRYLLLNNKKGATEK